MKSKVVIESYFSPHTELYLDNLLSIKNILDILEHKLQLDINYTYILKTTSGMLLDYNDLLLSVHPRYKHQDDRILYLILERTLKKKLLWFRF